MPLFASKKSKDESREEKLASPRASETSPNNARQSSNLFGRSNNRSSSNTPLAENSNGHNKTGLLHRNHEDATVTTARERLANAEAAEREADKALVAAKRAVKEAREHIKVLEAEAKAEAKAAKIKSEQAKSIGRRGKSLGRHEHS